MTGPKNSWIVAEPHSYSSPHKTVAFHASHASYQLMTD